MQKNIAQIRVHKRHPITKTRLKSLYEQPQVLNIDEIYN